MVFEAIDDNLPEVKPEPQKILPNKPRQIKAYPLANPPSTTG